MGRDARDGLWAHSMGGEEVIVVDLKNNQILVGELLDDPAAKAVFQKRFGKFMNHPMVPMARTLTLQQLVGFAQVYLPRMVINDTINDLKKL